MITYILISIFALAIICSFGFVISVNALYKSKNRRGINFKNEFPFETVPSFKGEYAYLNIFLLLSLLATISGFILYMVNNINVIPIVLVIVIVIYSFCVVSIPFIPLNRLKEHLYLSLGIIITDFIVSAFLTYLSYTVAKRFEFLKVAPIVAIVISGLLVIKSLIFIFNPKLFDLKYERNDQGELIRPKVVKLAFYQWSAIICSPLYLIAIILLTINL